LSRNFTSDNVAPACAAIMAAVNAANEGSAPSYGGDAYTARLQARVAAVFETPVSVYPVVTGTAANALAIAQISPPYGGVYCYEAAHIVTDECGAPGFFSGGATLLGLPAADGKITAMQVAAAVEQALSLGVHHVKPAAVSLTQATEWGTVYARAEVAAIAAVAKRHGLPMHMDGARFANALVHLGCSPAEATWKSGVDVLCLGATKNGALSAEAVVFFDPELAANFERRRKQSGHLWSKLRFLSAQLLAYLEPDVWLANARQANVMATALGSGLADLPGARLLQSVDANELFVALPEAVVAGLEAQGFGFYRWPAPGVDPTSDAGVSIRLVTSYLTSRTEVDGFVDAAAQIASRS
jgi:threonine aldolase